MTRQVTARFNVDDETLKISTTQWEIEMRAQDIRVHCCMNSNHSEELSQLFIETKLKEEEEEESESN